MFVIHWPVCPAYKRVSLLQSRSSLFTCLCQGMGLSRLSTCVQALLAAGIFVRVRAVHCLVFQRMWSE